MENKILLSICIPTYNRRDILIKQVSNILQCKDERFEIVVVDNCSTDSTGEILNLISDNRLKYHCNKTNIGGILNPFNAPLLAKGKYTMILLDKDGLYHDCLSDFIDFLSQNEVSHGFCQLEMISDIEQKIYLYDSGIDSVINTAYLSKHPSGMVWRTEEYRNSSVVEEINRNPIFFGFLFELVNAELSAKSKKNSFIYNKKLVYTEKTEECGKITTKTYSKKNVFFLPKQRNREYVIYLKNIKTLNLPKISYNTLIGVLLKRYCGSVLSFFYLKKNSIVLSHYGLKPKDLKLYDCFFSFFIFIFWYLFLYWDFNMVIKLKAVLKLFKD